MACHSCGMTGVEHFTHEQKQQGKGQCLYTAQGSIVCDGNKEYDKWIVVNDVNLKGKDPLASNPFEAFTSKY